ncbi:MAG: peptide-methionine (R)-S-oxide reductase [Chitinophagaceae bacterium]|nr:peptide-methionine (R)-S-oxide reductase [Chitinophagaceae bacterium]
MNEKKLSPKACQVTRLEGTGRAYSSKYWNHYEAGIYKYVCCGL